MRKVTTNEAKHARPRKKADIEVTYNKNTAKIVFQIKIPNISPWFYLDTNTKYFKVFHTQLF
jgi:hypothetical protein